VGIRDAAAAAALQPQLALRARALWPRHHRRQPCPRPG